MPDQRLSPFKVPRSRTIQRGVLAAAPVVLGAALVGCSAEVNVGTDGGFRVRVAGGGTQPGETT